jgi:hypothetical protein
MDAPTSSQSKRRGIRCLGITRISIHRCMHQPWRTRLSGRDTTTGTDSNTKETPLWQVLAAIINGTESVLTMLRINGVNCISTGGETADLGDLVRTVVVDSTVTCRMKKEDVIDNSNIQPGDLIVGLSSSGQATYEVCVRIERLVATLGEKVEGGSTHARSLARSQATRVCETCADSDTAATLLTDGVQRRHGQQRVDVGAARRADTHVRGQISRGVRPRGTRGPHLQRPIQAHGARLYDAEPGGFTWKRRAAVNRRWR